MASTGADEEHANGEEENPGEATLLVSEFPPPPFYYKAAAHLEPPEIPLEALARGTKRAAAFAAKARAESERLRLGDDDPDKTDAILGGAVPDQQEDEEGDVVAVFGEIVEDPIVVEPLEPCENPTVIRDELKRLNREVVQGFVNLVHELVHRPMDNKKMRDELSHNVFLMLQECNKFREHQARELLIDLLEQQLTERRKLVEELKTSISKADELLLGDGNVAKEGESGDVSESAAETKETTTTPIKPDDGGEAEPMNEG